MDDLIVFAEDIKSTAYGANGLTVELNNVLDKVTIKGAPALTRTDNQWLTETNGTATFGKTAGNDYVTSGKELTYKNVDAETYFTISGEQSVSNCAFVVNSERQCIVIGRKL